LYYNKNEFIKKITLEMYSSSKFGNKKPSSKKKPTRTTELRKSKVESIDASRRNNAETDNKLPNLNLDSVSYSVLTKTIMDKISVCKISETTRHQDVCHTTNDPRLGVLENNILCSTCNKPNDECPGHYGILNLPDCGIKESKIIHPLFRTPVTKTLQSLCFRCRQPLINRDDLMNINLKGIQRLNYIAKESKDLNHVNCIKTTTYPYNRNPIFKTGISKKTNNSNRSPIGIKGQVIIRKKKTIDYVCTPDFIYDLFDKLDKDTVSLLGFTGKNHPRNFIVDFIPVIPPSARPYAKREGVKKEDFITKFYDDVITETNKLSSGDCAETLERIVFLYSHIIDNSDKSYKKTGSEVIKAFKERLVGKQELIRGCLMGKRCDYTGRTVLGPNGGLEFGEIAPPEAMRSQLTIPEYVTVYNKGFIDGLVQSGEISCLVPGSGSFKGRKLKFNKDKHEIKIGDMVERWSRNGDVIIFNRQPTLQKQSMCAYRCKFQKKLSVGLHISSTTGHNADFDGDEGNIHMLQSSQAQSEAKLFMAAPSCVISSINSAPAGGIIYNAATGGYLLSDDNLILSKKMFMDGLNQMKYSSKELGIQIRKGEELTGKNLCSRLFPDTFWYQNGKVKICNGVLIQGRLTKKNMGPAPNSIVQALYKTYGTETARRFITDATFLFNWYIRVYGFTVGIKDCVAIDREKLKNTRDTEVEKINAEVTELVETSTAQTDMERMEQEDKINEIITMGTDKIKRQLVGTKDVKGMLAPDNSIGIMAESGAKGKVNDTTKIIALLGQQYVPNRRPDKGVSRGKRWLSSFHVDDNSIYSRGFVKSSFYEGLDPDEFFAHSMASRIGLSNTAVKTADIGAIQRRMVKSMEDLIVQYDGSVRNQNGTIFQFSYGAGFGSSKMLRQNKDGNGYLTFINLHEVIGQINSNVTFATVQSLFD
jgi:DNA-directed RNA polymerase beta' subunit